MEFSANYPFIVAEISCNHEGDYDKARTLIQAAKDAGADAVKIQIYSPDDMTMPGVATAPSGPWKGRDLYELYTKTQTTDDMAMYAFKAAKEIDIPMFASVFSPDTVEFLEDYDICPAYKVASFEINHIPLLRCIARTGKQVVISTGMATFAEIDRAFDIFDPKQVILLHCVSSYPTEPSQMNLKRIQWLKNWFHCPVGFSDHTVLTNSGANAVLASADILEKHLNLYNATEDTEFSLTPIEFKDYVKYARLAASLYQAKHATEQDMHFFRRSVYASKDIKKGESFYGKIVVIRPSDGLDPADYDKIERGTAAMDIPAGTPLKKEHING